MRLLEEHGHRVTLTTNGREALAALEQENFDVVLMDVQMPANCCRSLGRCHFQGTGQSG